MSREEETNATIGIAIAAVRLGCKLAEVRQRQRQSSTAIKQKKKKQK